MPTNIASLIKQSPPPIRVGGMGIYDLPDGYVVVDADGDLHRLTKSDAGLACADTDCVGACVHVRAVRTAQPLLAKMASVQPVSFTFSAADRAILQDATDLLDGITVLGGYSPRIETTMRDLFKARQQLAGQVSDPDVRQLVARLDHVIDSTPLAKAGGWPTLTRPVSAWERSYFHANAPQVAAKGIDPNPIFDSMAHRPEIQHRHMAELHQRMAERGIEHPVQPPIKRLGDDLASLRHRMVHAQSMQQHSPNKGDIYHQIRWKHEHESAFDTTHTWMRQHPDVDENG